MTTRAEIVQEARRWLGTPFLHQGRVLGHGVDCAGIIVMLARRFGFDQGYQDPPGYPPEPHRDFMERLLDRYLVPVPRPERRPADIITFDWSTHAGHVHHLAILTEPDLILHAYNPGRVRRPTRQPAKVLETGLRGPFLKAMRRVYKFRGLD